MAYFELVAASTRLQVTTDLRGFAERTRDAARDRFQAGAAPRLEALQSELALATVDNEQEAARGRLEVHESSEHVDGPRMRPPIRRMASTSAACRLTLRRRSPPVRMRQSIDRSTRRSRGQLAGDAHA